MAKLLDFGLVKPLGEKIDTQLTQEGSIAGSPLFMSPEQATGDDRVDGRSALLAGRANVLHAHRPAALRLRESSEGDHRARQREAVVPPRQVASPDVPVGLEEVIMRCLEKDPEDRFQDVTAVQRALRDVQLSEPWSSGARRPVVELQRLPRAEETGRCPWSRPRPCSARGLDRR